MIFNGDNQDVDTYDIWTSPNMGKLLAKKKHQNLRGLNNAINQPWLEMDGKSHRKKKWWNYGWNWEMQMAASLPTVNLRVSFMIMLIIKFQLSSGSKDDDLLNRARFVQSGWIRKLLEWHVPRWQSENSMSQPCLSPAATGDAAETKRWASSALFRLAPTSSMSMLNGVWYDIYFLSKYMNNPRQSDSLQKRKATPHLRVSINGGTPSSLDGFCSGQSHRSKWMMTGGTPISGNHHF